MDLEKNLRTNVVDLESKKEAQTSKEKRLKRLQQLIDRGEYKVSSEEIAESLINKEEKSKTKDPLFTTLIQSEKNSKNK